MCWSRVTDSEVRRFLASEGEKIKGWFSEAEVHS